MLVAGSWRLMTADGRWLQVVSAPTGSGKTGVMELAMIRLFSKRITADGSFSPPAGAAKVVYLAPMRALVQEKVKSWRDRCAGLRAVMKVS